MLLKLCQNFTYTIHESCLIYFSLFSNIYYDSIEDKHVFVVRYAHGSLITWLNDSLYARMNEKFLADRKIIIEVDSILIDR